MEAIVYVRWSTDDQTLGDSKKRQTELAQKLCQAQDWTIIETVIEAGKSAFPRPPSRRWWEARRH